MKEQIEKQAIEEMAKVIKSSLDGLGIGNFNFTGDEISTMFAKALYNASYRKQSEEEWETIPNHLPETAKYRHRCIGCDYFYKDTKPYGHKYCPNCGAKMKGGAE